MAPTERRRSPRIPARLPVSLSAGGRQERLETVEVGLRGVFLASETPRPLRQLVSLTITLPDGLPFDVQGMVARVVSNEEARDAGVPAGMGVQFYGLSVGAGERWESFLERLRTSGAPPAGLGVAPPSQADSGSHYVPPPPPAGRGGARRPTPRPSSSKGPPAASQPPAQDPADVMEGHVPEARGAATPRRAADEGTVALPRDGTPPVVEQRGSFSEVIARPSPTLETAAPPSLLDQDPPGLDGPETATQTEAPDFSDGRATSSEPIVVGDGSTTQAPPRRITPPATRDLRADALRRAPAARFPDEDIPTLSYTPGGTPALGAASAVEPRVERAALARRAGDVTLDLGRPETTSAFVEESDAAAPTFQRPAHRFVEHEIPTTVSPPRADVTERAARRSRRPTPTAPAHAPDETIGACVYRLALPSVGALEQFSKTALFAGGVFVRTTDLRPPGTAAVVSVVHPLSGDEFQLPGEVVEQPPGRGGVAVKLHGVTSRTISEFRYFVALGIPDDEPSQAGPKDFHMFSEDDEDLSWVQPASPELTGEDVARRENTLEVKLEDLGPFTEDDDLPDLF